MVGDVCLRWCFEYHWGVTTLWVPVTFSARTKSTAVRCSMCHFFHVSQTHNLPHLFPFPPWMKLGESKITHSNLCLLWGATTRTKQFQSWIKRQITAVSYWPTLNGHRGRRIPGWWTIQKWEKGQQLMILNSSTRDANQRHFKTKWSSSKWDRTLNC